MKDFYLWRVIRDLTYSGLAVYSVYTVVSMIVSDHHISLGEEFFALFLLLGLIFVIAETEDEKKPRRFTVKIDGHEYQSDEYSLNIMKKGSHIQMNGDEYVAIDNIKSVEILRNPGHPDKKGHAIDLSEILKHTHEFAEECQVQEANSSDVGCKSESASTGKKYPNFYGDSVTEAVKKTVKKRRAPNAGKKMSEEQKAKISASLKKMNAEKRAQNARIEKTRLAKFKREASLKTKK